MAPDQIFFITSWESIAKNPDNVPMSVIMKGVFDADDDICWMACQALRNRRSKEDAEPFVTRLIKHDRARVRKTTAEILPAISRSLALEHCPTMALQDENVEVCGAAFRTTLEILIESPEGPARKGVELFSPSFAKERKQEEAADALLSFLGAAIDSERTDIRLIAAKNLSFLRNDNRPSHYFLVAKRLASDEVERVREEVVREVAWMHDERSLELIRTIIPGTPYLIQMSLTWIISPNKSFQRTAYSRR